MRFQRGRLQGIDQVLQVGGRVLFGEQASVQQFMQFLDFQLQEIRGRGPIGRDEVMRAAAVAGGEQACVAMPLDEGVHVAVAVGQFGFGPGFQIVRDAFAAGRHDTPRPIPAAAAEHEAERLAGQGASGRFEQAAVMRARRRGFEFGNELPQGVIVDGAAVHVVSLVRFSLRRAHTCSRTS